MARQRRSTAKDMLRISPTRSVLGGSAMPQSALRIKPEYTPVERSTSSSKGNTVLSGEYVCELEMLLWA